LRSQAGKVFQPPKTYDETADDWPRHSDIGDLFVTIRVEVKWLTALFTGRKDWPEKFHGHFMVDSVYSYNRKAPKPNCHLFLSEGKATIARVQGDTWTEWYEEERFDSQYQKMLKFWFCPMDLVEFFPFGGKDCPVPLV